MKKDDLTEEEAFHLYDYACKKSRNAKKLFRANY